MMVGCRRAGMVVDMAMAATISDSGATVDVVDWPLLGTWVAVVRRGLGTGFVRGGGAVYHDGQ
jgi:hypothetical protein